MFSPDSSEGSKVPIFSQNSAFKKLSQFDHPQAHKDLLELQKGRVPPVKKGTQFEPTDGIFVSRL